MTESQRIRGLAQEEAPIWIRAYFALQRQRYGVVLEPTRVWARAPAPMRAFLHFVAAVDRQSSPIEPSLRSLIMVKISQINSCAFCVDFNAARLEERGVRPEKALALNDYKTSRLFSNKERTALDYAVAIATTTAAVDETLFNRLRKYFDENAIVELTALIVLQIASSKFNAALGISSQGFCQTRDGETG